MALGSSVLSRAIYAYDNASRLASVSDGNNDSATYSYVANSPLVSQIALKQNGLTRMTTSKQWDYLNRLTAIASQANAAYTSPLTFNYNYNPANQRTKDTLADGSYWIYAYDSLGQVTNGCKYFSNGTPVPGQQFDYTFDTRPVRYGRFLLCLCSAQPRRRPSLCWPYAGFAQPLQSAPARRGSFHQGAAAV